MKPKRLLFFIAGFIILAAVIFDSFLSKRSIPVFTYHSIGMNRSDISVDVSDGNFARQMAFISRNKYKVISFEDMAGILRDNKPFPVKSVVLTFDDGYKNNYLRAFPVLKKYGFPAALFVVSSYVKGGESISWGQIREMAENGITIGSHTVNHHNLPGLTLQEAAFELAESKKEIEKNIGREVKFLAYPNGGYSEAVKMLARISGYKAACTTNRGQGRDIYEIRRIKMTNNSNPLVMWMKLSGFYDVFRKEKAPN